MTSVPIMDRRPLPSALDDAAAWAAVETRDARQDGVFFYAVRTTGVYCRPSCSSRRPRRENVSFFPNADAAERAGFRACRRCRPRELRLVGGGDDPLSKARAYLDAHADERVTLAELSRVARMSAAHLQRQFTSRFGVSPRRYLAALRAERFKNELRDPSERTVSRATFEAGYGASSRAYEAAADHLAMTPAAYRRGGLGVAIRYTVTTTDLGALLVAVTARGVCAVSIGDDAGALEQSLEREYPRASRDRVELGALAADDPLNDWTARIVRHLAGAVERLDLPTDVPGTAFQEDVWRAVRTIPPGETRTYSDVARSLGRPQAARAVARAVASNRVALVIPCHRVVMVGDDDVGGYRWGAERKKRILEREHAVAVRVVR
jgi:AraC family transcriptional regulator of adaptative response/methylated-DNA-[protein]-cysteine methyltransferase